MQDNNNTILKEKTVLIVLCVILFAVIGSLIVREATRKPAWDAEYPMANQHIEWNYAKENVKDGL